MNDMDLYEDMTYQKECRKCLEKEQTSDEASDFLSSIVKQLYTQEPINKENLVHCIEELCFLLHVTMPKGEIQIDRKRLPILEDWIAFNNNYLAKLA